MKKKEKKVNNETANWISDLRINVGQSFCGLLLNYHQVICRVFVVKIIDFCTILRSPWKSLYVFFPWEVNKSNANSNCLLMAGDFCKNLNIFFHRCSNRFLRFYEWWSISSTHSMRNKCCHVHVRNWIKFIFKPHKTSQFQ